MVQALEIVYLAPALQVPIGGIKVMYRHSEMLNQLGVCSTVFHPENPNFVCRWFEHQAKMRGGRTPWWRKKHAMHETPPFNPLSDFLVIPEVWALQIGEQCIARGLRFAIFVQNGYMIEEGGQKNRAQLDVIYQQASLILSISTNTTQMIELAFPALNPNKIIAIGPDLSSFSMASDPPKKKWISYVPKKLMQHAKLVNFLMRPYLPADWSMVAIENRTEQEVREILCASSIFLSFSDAEGFGLPPLEAALCGNRVVGYSGQGGKEYFAPPIFTEINQGDYLAFIAGIRSAIAWCEHDDGAVMEQIRAQRSELAQRYSLESQLRQLAVFSAAVQTLMQGAR